ncbi:MAG: hypothetical protein RLZZ157_1004 [Pseudomonadota bacterium]
MGLTNRVKARASRSAALTRLLKPALCSEVTDTQQWMQHFGKGGAVTKVNPKPLLLLRVNPTSEPCLPSRQSCVHGCVGLCDFGKRVISEWVLVAGQRAAGVSRLAIIGGGVAGLACARVVHGAGHHVEVFDKGRGPGGRLSTRRVDQEGGKPALRFDHGAQYLTAHDPAFCAEIARLEALGAVAPWTGWLVQIAGDGAQKPLGNGPFYVGTPSMNDVVRALAGGISVRWGTRVGRLARGADAQWQLLDEAGATLGAFDHVICATPAEQVAPLLGAHAPQLAARARAVTSLPCWAGLFAFEAPLPLSFDGARFVDHPILDFVACGPSKPGRAPSPCYVVHATPAWSTLMLEEGQDLIAKALLAALLDLADSAAKPCFAAAHRWRYARVGAVADNGVAYDWDAQMGVCGDWLSGPRVESAWLSGYRLGLALRARLAAPAT